MSIKIMVSKIIEWVWVNLYISYRVKTVMSVKDTGYDHNFSLSRLKDKKASIAPQNIK